jgi:Uma2 family endonuclease
MDTLTVHEYFESPETVRPMELVYGLVREPAMPNYQHQRIATRLLALLYAHVQPRGVGEVLSPIDVVLDEAAALVVQPDLVFVGRDRLGIIRERIWGPPDLVVEILSPSTARRDRTIKLGWYRKYGVRECWLVDARTHRVEVIELQSTTPARLFWRPQRLRSTVLPDWDLPVEQIFV